MLFQARTYSVLVVSASEKFNSSTTSLLSVTDYWSVTYADSVGLARRRLLECAYDIVLINAPLPDDFGMRLAIDICGSSQAGVLLFVKNELHDEIYSKVVEYGVMTISKPTSTQMVAQSLRLLCAVRERLRRMEERQLTVQEKIDEIRLVNRAKWLLIEKMHMTENEAHHHIEKQSMDLRISKSEIAEDIIKTYQ